jgi:hypothetical protein
MSAVAPVTDVVRDEIIALLAEPADPAPAVDVRLGMDPVEIAQEQTDDDEDDVALLRVSPVIPV